MTRNRLLSLALIVAAGMTGPASAGAQTRWMVLRTDHFDIYYQRQHEHALDEIAREADRAYARVSFDLQHELAARMPLILLQTERELPQDPRQASELVRASGAPDRDHLVLALEPSESRAAVLIHELTHQFNFEMLPAWTRVPGWAHEGLADHEAGRWTASELVKLRDRAAARAVPAVTSLADSDRLWGHAVFDFVAAEYGAQGVRRYLTALGNSSSAADSTLTAFGIAASDFDRAFQTYVKARFNDR